MDEFEASIHRTWIDLLMAKGLAEVAALLVDAEIYVMYHEHWSDSVEAMVQGDPSWLKVDVPPFSHNYFAEDPRSWENAIEALRPVVRGRFFDRGGEVRNGQELLIDFRIKLLQVEEDWKDVIRELITSPKDSNQGVITELVFAKRGNKPHVYNEMKFGSQSEIKIAMELETRGVLFFPLPLAVRHETGDRYKDRREPDFLVCYEGKFGVLEVSGHGPERYEKDAEKNHWFKQSKIRCVESYTAERCYKQPSVVVDQFLKILDSMY